MPRSAALAVLLAAVALAEEPTLEFEGKRVQLTPEGNIGRIYTDSDVEREIETLLAAPAPAEQNVWQCRVFIFRKTDADWEDAEGKKRHTTAEMSDEDVEGLRKAIERFQRSVEAYTGRLLRLELTLRVVDEPLTTVSGSKGQYLAWSEATDPHIGDDVEEGQVDNVMVFWVPGDIQLGIYWGGTVGGCYKGAGYTSIAYIHPGACDVHAYFEVALHEWLHQAEWARAWKMGYTDLPDLHMATQMGYPADGVSRGWMDWYRDFMGVYFTPRMWRKLSMTRSDPDRPRVSGEGGFCREWLVAGPFPNENDAGLDRELIDEERCEPDEGEEATGKSWAIARGDDVLDLAAALSPSDNGVAYLHAYVQAPDGPARLWIGSDDGVKAWWNGRRVLQHHVHRPCERDQDWVDIEVRRGWNRLLLKVDQGFGGWAACARLATRDGKPLGAEWRGRRSGNDVVAADPNPLLAPDWEPKGCKWAEVQDDPWRLLPQWGEAELRRLTRFNALALAGGDSDLLLDLGEDDEIGCRRSANPAEAVLDNGLTFSSEGLAYVPWRRPRADGNPVIPRLPYFLVRPDVAPFLAHRAAIGDVDFVAWIQVDRRPAFIARLDHFRDVGDAYSYPANRDSSPRLPSLRHSSETRFLEDRRGDIRFDLHIWDGGLVAGATGDGVLVISSEGMEAELTDVKLCVEGEARLTSLEGPPAGPIPAQEARLVRFKLAAPADIAKTSHSLLIASATVDGVPMRDVCRSRCATHGR